MKVLLRDSRTGKYCGREAEWVAEPTAALEFVDIRNAGKRAREQVELELDVVLKYDNPPCELALNPAFCV